MTNTHIVSCMNATGIVNRCEKIFHPGFQRHLNITTDTDNTNTHTHTHTDPIHTKTNALGVLTSVINTSPVPAVQSDPGGWWQEHVFLSLLPVNRYV